MIARRPTGDPGPPGPAELDAVDVEGTRYVWPADLAPVEIDPPARVRFLAPFDPVVWDRRRFAQLWGWEYRFEAYTPAQIVPDPGIIPASARIEESL